MARIRTIKPEHWNDKRLPDITLQAHLLWIALWNFSDDEGIFEADLNLIRSQVFPRRTDIRTEQVEQWIGQLVKARFVIPFTYNGEGYYITRTFKTHQKIDKPKASNIPKELIDKVKKDFRHRFDDQSTTNPRTVDDESSLVEESSGEESTSSVEESRSAPLVEDGLIFFNAEEVVLKNQIWLEQLCLRKGKSLDLANDVLHKYHLWLEENEKYPKTRKAIFAGFEKWLLTEKSTSKNGYSPTSTVGKEIKFDRP